MANREINFRAWDGKNMLNRTLCDRNWYNKEDKIVCIAMPNDKRRLKIMQFTGFKDKNKKDIYEGDIIKAEEGYGIVEFRRGSFHVVWYGVAGELMEYGFDEDSGGFGEIEDECFCEILVDELEVVGNKFENKDALLGGDE